jgi:gas vesicle protein
MSGNSGNANQARRNFLRGVATGSVLAAAAAAIAAPQRAAASESKADRKKARYKETEHVKRFYQTNRY